MSSANDYLDAFNGEVMAIMQKHGYETHKLKEGWEIIKLGDEFGMGLMRKKREILTAMISFPDFNNASPTINVGTYVPDGNNLIAAVDDLKDICNKKLGKQMTVSYRKMV